MKWECADCPTQKKTRYRHRLTVKSPSGTADEYGQIDLDDSDNATTEGTIKANFVSKGGREFFRGEQIQADVTHLLETPSKSLSRSLQPNWWLVMGSRTFQIVASFDVNEERNIVQIQVKESK